MKSQIVEVAVNNWHIKETDRLWIDALEGGKILYFPKLAFKLEEHEKRLLTPTILDPKVRNISLAGNNPIKGVAADENTASILTDMVSRFRAQSESLVYSLLPKYQGALRLAPPVIGRPKSKTASSLGEPMTAGCTSMLFRRDLIMASVFCVFLATL